MSSEFNSGQRVERGELAHTERALQKIEDHIKDAELGSVRFQAFADYADLADAESLLQKDRHDSITQIEYSLINETIRQRQNGLIGYKKEYKNAEKLATKLGEAIDIDRTNGEGGLDFYVYLRSIKNKGIDERTSNPRS